MKRRNFLKNIGKLSSAPLILNGVGVSPFVSPGMLEFFNTCTGIEDRTLVVLFLKGGNDGLNTLIPIDQYDTYINHRPTIGLASSGTGAFINLDSTLGVAEQIGLHPSMTNFKSMYEAGKARIIQAVGYPSFNQSHFKSTDYWLSGRDGSYAAASGDGWIGRFFEHAYPGVHGNPNTQFPDPLGMQFGDTKASLSFHDCTSTYEAVNLTGQNPGELFGLLNGLGTAPHADTPLSEYGAEIDYIMSVENSTNVYGERITNVYNSGTNSAVVYPDSYLGYQFSLVARMLSGGSKTKMFMVHKGGFDTHAGQVMAGTPHIGEHAELLTDVFDSIKAFHDDLTSLGMSEKVVTVVFSEFSRRITENGSNGTDHGNYGPMFIFGDAVNPGVSGTNFDISQINDSGNMLETEIQHDYRDVFKTLLQNWMGAGDDILEPAQMLEFNIMPELIIPEQIVDPSCYISLIALPAELSFFDAQLTPEQHVSLQWETISEINVDHFAIVRMQEGRPETEINQVQAVGESTTSQFYETFDREPLPGLNYYRLKMVDRDGSIKWSDWRSVNLPEVALQHAKIYPNPAAYDFNMVFNSNQQTEGMVEFFNMQGQLVRTEQVAIREGFNKFTFLVNNMIAGTYVAKINLNGLPAHTFTLVIKR